MTENEDFTSNDDTPTKRKFSRRIAAGIAAIVLSTCALLPFAIPSPQWVPYGKCASARTELMNHEAQGLRIWRQFNATMKSRGEDPFHATPSLDFQTLDAIAATLLLKVYDQDEAAAAAIVSAPSCFDEAVVKRAEFSQGTVDLRRVIAELAKKDSNSLYVKRDTYPHFYSLLDQKQLDQ